MDRRDQFCLTDIQLLTAVYEAARTVKSGKRTTTVNELTDQLPAMRPRVLQAAARSLMNLGSVHGVGKVLVEEDKGAALGALVSVYTDLPLAMARFYAYEIPGTIKVPISMEYFEGHLLVNGLERGDDILLVDDTLSTGGTVVALAEAVAIAGARIVEIRVVVEKLGFGGRARLQEALGIEVKACIGISITDGKVSVDEVMASW